MKQRVICVIGRVLDQEDGLGVYALNVLRCMMAVDHLTKYVVLLRTSMHQESFREFPNAETKIIRNPIKIIWDQVEVARAARNMSADIVFNPKFSLPLFSFRPGAMVLHASDWYVNPGNYEWWDNLYIRLVMPLYFRKATCLLSISQCVVDDLMKYTSLDKSKVTVTYAAAGSEFSPVTCQETLHDFALLFKLPEQFILGIARAYHTGHGHAPPYPGGNVEGLVQGYQLFRKKGGTLPLAIAGKDIDKYLKIKGFAKADLEGISFLGFIPHEKMVFLYNLAQFFVLTTLYESFSLPLVEAMASGCPVIAPSTGACPEVAGPAALLVDPRDPARIGEVMFRMSKDHELRGTLRRQGLDRGKMFSWERTAQLTLRAFEEIVPSF